MGVNWWEGVVVKYYDCVCAEGIFDAVNTETDKRDKEKRFSHRKISTSSMGEMWPLLES